MTPPYRPPHGLDGLSREDLLVVIEELVAINAAEHHRAGLYEKAFQRLISPTSDVPTAAIALQIAQT